MGAFSASSQQNPASSASAPAADSNSSNNNTNDSNTDNNSTITSTITGRSSSFLSRFHAALPRRSRTSRSVADFHIRPAEPHRKYVAGDHVEGAVVLTLVKPLRITHLTVALHGFVRVFRAPGAASEGSVVVPAEVVAVDGRSSSPSSSFSRSAGNGHASLFHDQQVLSSEGKLEPGRYEFGFDLVFPSEGLPSSIDFERGTISYVITATLTWPASITAMQKTPMQSCERKVYLVDQVDIGPLKPPRARTIYLEPISKRTKKRKVIVTERGSAAAVAIGAGSPAPALTPALPAAAETQQEPPVAGERNSAEGSIVADDASQDVHYHPRSPIPSDIRSEVSGDSIVSGSTGRSGRGGHESNNHTSSSGSQGAVVTCRTPTADDRTITAVIELQKGGCLPGDVISVKIDVQHVKRIKSMHGVVVTLYRQGRIDSAPPVSRSNSNANGGSTSTTSGGSDAGASSLSSKGADKGRRSDVDPYFPRSRTGLAGLSLRSATTCSVFRKDLSQSFTPLIIDPVTLKSTVTALVRMPEDAFPTIKGVPGDMISFKYQLEVIVDLGGKLASLLQSGQSKSNPIGMGGAAAISGALARNPYDSGMMSSNIIDTDQLRRQKGVISVAFEVIVGTSDSSRQRLRGLSRPPAPLSPAPPQTEERKEAGGGHGNWQDGVDDEGYGPDGEAPYPYDDGYGSYAGDSSRGPQYQHQQWHPQQQHPHYMPPEPSRPPALAPAPFYVPAPEMADERNLSEKERIRRAEERLLPSQPPGAPPPAAGPSTAHVPAEEEDIYDAEDGPSARRPPPPPQDMYFREREVQSEGGEDARHRPSAPTLEEVEQPPPWPSSSARQQQQQQQLEQTHPTEDKQELERLRLLAEASAPLQFPDDYDAGAAAASSSAPYAPAGSSGAGVPAYEPSAPVLSEEDEEAAGGYYYASIAGPSGPSRRRSRGRGGSPSGSGAEGRDAGAEPLPRYER